MVESEWNEEYLGMRGKDKISGVKGIIYAVDKWLNGCVRYAIKPEEVKDGQDIPATWVDAVQIEIISEKTKMKPAVKATGGPRHSDSFR